WNVAASDMTRTSHGSKRLTNRETLSLGGLAGDEEEAVDWSSLIYGTDYSEANNVSEYGLLPDYCMRARKPRRMIRRFPAQTVRIPQITMTIAGLRHNRC